MGPSGDGRARGRGRKRWVWYGVYVVPSFVGLAGVLIALGRGYAPGRLWPVAGFLVVWAASAGYLTAARRAFRRRTRTVRSVPVPRGVRLMTPFWIWLEAWVMAVGLIAAPGTIVAALGFPGIAVGILLVVGGMVLFAGTVSLWEVRGLTFEAAGLRCHLARSACLVPWNAIADLEVLGPDHHQVVWFSIRDFDRVVDSVNPDNSRSRARVRATLGRGRVMFQPWTAGLDGETLARAITDAGTGVPERLN